MRQCLFISLLLVTAMLVGCQTQTWKGTDYAPGAGRGPNIYQLHGGLWEVQGAVAAGWSAGTSDTSDDFEAIGGGGQISVGYMINDFWEFGALAEYTHDVFDPDGDVLDDIDVNGWAIGPRITYNFSNVGTDVVPYAEICGGMGKATFDSDEIDKEKADMTFAQAGFGVRLFAWDAIAWDFEGFYRWAGYDFDKGNVKARKNRPGEFGVSIGISVFF